MRCSRCGADNAAGRRFCATCGAKLAAGCAGCGFANEPEARFCGGCGAPLSTAAGAVEPGGGRPEPERRQVAVLFANLVGFTRLTAELGAEDTQALLEAFF